VKSESPRKRWCATDHCQTQVEMSAFQPSRNVRLGSSDQLERRCFVSRTSALRRRAVRSLCALVRAFCSASREVPRGAQRIFQIGSACQHGRRSAGAAPTRVYGRDGCDRGREVDEGSLLESRLRDQVDRSRVAGGRSTSGRYSCSISTRTGCPAPPSCSRWDSMICSSSRRRRSASGRIAHRLRCLPSGSRWHPSPADRIRGA
jgi:hypothetical protein